MGGVYEGFGADRPAERGKSGKKNSICTRTGEMGMLSRKRKLSVADCRVGIWRTMRETEATS